MTASSKPMKGWGDLNIALNTLVQDGTILGYKTNRAAKEEKTEIEVSTAAGADQAEIVRRVRDLLSGIFSDATVRTRAA